MGDLTRGETFASGELVTAARLHKLVEDAVINQDAITEDKIKDGAVTADKLAVSIRLEATQVNVEKDKILAGDADGHGVSMAAGGGLSILPAGAGLTIADKGVTEAKLGDLAVTAAKLADLSPSPAGTYGAPDKIPKIVVSAKGLVTGVTLETVSGGSGGSGVYKSGSDNKAIPAPGAQVSFPHGFGAIPPVINVYLNSKINTIGYTALVEKIPAYCALANNSAPAFSVTVTQQDIIVTRNVNPEFWIMNKTNGSYVELQGANQVTNWELTASAWM